MPSLHSFYVHTDAHPRLSNTDELMIVHRDQIVPNSTIYVGAHQVTSFEIRSGSNRETVEGATPTLYTLPAGGKMRIDLAVPLLQVTKITPLTGQIYVWICAMGEFDTYLKQVDVPSI